MKITTAVNQAKQALKSKPKLRTLTIPVQTDAPIPKGFERYIILKTASDLLKIEAEKLYQRIIEE